MNTINCEHPILIYNPNLNKLILNGYNKIVSPSYSFYLDKDKYISVFNSESIYFKEFNILDYYTNGIDKLFYKDYKKLSAKDKRSYYPKYKSSIDQILNDFYITNGSVNEPLFIAVPCGNKCNICRKKKIDEWSQRVMFHNSQCENPPFFVTLTLNADFFARYDVSDKESQVCLIQKFLKRLRINLTRAGYNNRFKYFLTSEYGSKSGRLHFHAIFMNVNKELYKVCANTYEDKFNFPFIYKFNKFLRDAWSDKDKSFGFVTCYIAKDERGQYAMKYISKQDNICLHSIKIGYDALEKYKENLVNSPCEEYLHFTGRFEGKITVSKWILKKVLPSLVESLSSEYRKALEICYISIYRMRRWYYLHTNRLIVDYISNDYVKYFETKMYYFKEFFSEFSELIDCLYYGDHHIDVVNNIFTLDDLMNELTKFMLSYSKLICDYEFNLDRLIYLHGQRNKRFLFTNYLLKDIDLTLNSVKASKFFADMENKEVL